ncbi:MAG: DUF1330 domain-containing protein [Porticoccaceae bacterium]|nr:DUF1330 domain-containing protein [Porticoccaceae bacterium]OUS10962.1 hypothetical protein A9Q90_00190 [Gammaproteobacteria bacterium 54_18_T64]
MAAYVIVDVKVTDPEAYEAYKKLAPAAIEAFGGEYLARGGAVDVFEGNRTPNRTVILRFESMAKARAWVDSEQYREARMARHKSAVSQMMVVEGV